MDIYSMDKYAALVLAAGKGTRMHSCKPKVLQNLLGSPMLQYVLAALKPLFLNSIWVVTGHESGQLESAFPDSKFILQSPQLGTGHAVKIALENSELAEHEYILIVNGDSPLLTSEIVRDFILAATDCDLAFSTITLADPGQYGRVLRKNGEPAAIIEAKDFDPEKHEGYSGEVNAGLYFIKTAATRNLLNLLDNNNGSAEYYLTDLVAKALENNLKVVAFNCGSAKALLGVNTPLELAQAENIIAERTAEALLSNGILLHSPQFVRCSPFAKIEPGCEIFGPCEIYGNTEIKANAIIESHCVIIDSEINKDAKIRSFSHLENASVGENDSVGPYTRLRPGAKLDQDVHVGNFVEIKKTALGAGAKANHLAYLGDAEIGEGTNIGAGTITCNYDGKAKHSTTIGKNAFIGSNSALVAPVVIGDGAFVGAGSVITKNVPAGELGIARAKQQNLTAKLKK